MSQIRLGRYVAPKEAPLSYAVVAVITRADKVNVRFLNDEWYLLHPYDPDDIMLLPRGVVKVKAKSTKKAQLD